MKSKDKVKNLQDLILKKDKATKPVPPARKIKAIAKPRPMAKSQEAPTGKLELVHEDKLLFKGKLNYFIMGKLPMAFESLKVTLVVTEETSMKRNIFKVDLYEYEEVQRTKESIARLFLMEEELVGADMLQLATLIDNRRSEQVIYRNIEMEESGKMSHGEERTARALLMGSDIIGRIDQLIEKAGIVGQKDIRLLLFLTASSYKSAVPLHLGLKGNPDTVNEIIGKTGGFIPSEDRLLLNNVSARSFYHCTSGQLKGKALFLPNGLEKKAAHAMKLLQQSGVLTTATTQKDMLGDMVSALKQVKSHFSSITMLPDTDEGNAAMLKICLDEREEQTKKLLQYQNNKYAGTIHEEEEKRAADLLRHIIYCIEPVEVVNPFAGKVIIPVRPENVIAINNLFQALVSQVSLLHQYKRKKDKEGRLVAELPDIKAACDIFVKTVSFETDELDPQARKFFTDLKRYVIEKGGDKPNEYWFTLRELRDEMAIAKTSCHRYMKPLQDMEYVEDDQGHKNTGLKYRIAYWEDIDKNRKKLKESISAQLQKLGVPPVPHRVGTPEPATAKASAGGVPSAA